MKRRAKNLRNRRLTGILLAACVLSAMIFGTVTAQASEEEEYTYTVRVFGGNKGTVNGQEMVMDDQLKAGGSVSFKLQSTDSRYVVKGVRESGRAEGPIYANSAPVTVNGVSRDRDYVAVYGVEGKTVRYTVNYVAVDGSVLAPSEYFYGEVGDVPVVAYRYIDGYFPNTRNLTKVRGLSADASENVFSFVYQPNPVETVIVTPTPGPNDTVVVYVTATPKPGGNANAASTPAATPAPSPEAGDPEQEDREEAGTDTAEAGTDETGEGAGEEAAAEEAPAEEEAPVVPETEDLPSSPEEVPEMTDIDEGEVPSAAPDDEGGEDDEKAEPTATPAPEKPAPGNGLSGGIIAALAAALIAILAAIVIALKKRGKNSDRL